MSQRASYNFPVAAVDPGTSFVLENWRAIVLKEINPTQTRLIVRTHGSELPDLKSKIVDFIGAPLHYIMERKMLMGLKPRLNLLVTPDYLHLRIIYGCLEFFCHTPV
jgi:hypothetical protein